MKLDELVEAVAGDHGRPAALLVQRGALDVDRDDHREQHAAGQEDRPRQPERPLRHEADARSRSTPR